MVSQPSLRIEPAKPEEVPLILELIRELAAFERLSHQVVATEELLREHLFGSKPRAEVLIAREGPTPVGFALFFHNFSTFLSRPGLYLEDLFISPAFRGRGHGEALLRHLARLALERGCGRFEWAVLDWNERAIAFYRRLGAVPMSDWTGYRVTGMALESLAGS